ncbi:bestrophin family protein, partial [Singulisphaera rosea]
MIHYKKRDWSAHLFDLRGTMTHEIVGRVSACVVWCVAVVIFHHLIRPVDFSPIAHTLVGVALGLLLVFRTNASYDRFWEGRRLWGSLINETRNLARATLAFVGRDRAIYERIVYWT